MHKATYASSLRVFNDGLYVRLDAGTYQFFERLAVVDLALKQVLTCR